jgi:hypothetical protein
MSILIDMVVRGHEAAAGSVERKAIAFTTKYGIRLMYDLNKKADVTEGIESWIGRSDVSCATEGTTRLVCCTLFDLLHLALRTDLRPNRTCACNHGEFDSIS